MAKVATKPTDSTTLGLARGKHLLTSSLPQCGSITELIS